MRNKDLSAWYIIILATAFFNAPVVIPGIFRAKTPAPARCRRFRLAATNGALLVAAKRRHHTGQE